MSDKQAAFILKLHNFCMKLQHKHPLIASFGATGINMLMGYCYMSVLRQGANYVNSTKP